MRVFKGSKKAFKSIEEALEDYTKVYLDSYYYKDEIFKKKNFNLFLIDILDVMKRTNEYWSSQVVRVEKGKPLPFPNGDSFSLRQDGYGYYIAPETTFVTYLNYQELANFLDTAFDMFWKIKAEYKKMENS